MKKHISTSENSKNFLRNVTGNAYFPKKINTAGIAILIMVLIFGASSFKTINEPLIKILDRLDYLIHYYPQEKIFVHTDKAHYILGDTVWFNVTVTDASFHEKDPVSGLVYVQLVNQDGVVVEKLNLRLDGKNAHGEFVLTEDLIYGRYEIEAFTQYMLNYDKAYLFSKTIMIWETSVLQENPDLWVLPETTDSIRLKFYPEGGDIFENINTVVAFEALNSEGHPMQVSIIVKDENHIPVTQSQTLHDGMGFFSLTGLSSKKYYAEVNGVHYPLPPVKKKGINIKVVNRQSDYFSVILESNFENGLDGTFLVGHIRGQAFYTNDELSGQVRKLKIEKTELPSGVAQITLYSKSGIPLCERSLFIYTKRDFPVVEVNMPFAYQLERSEAYVSVDLKDHEGLPAEASFSVSVSDCGTIPFTGNEDDIHSNFLLTSELTSHLRNPGFYFMDMTSQKYALLDLAMMIHGWTRIKSENLVSDVEPQLRYAPEKGFVVSGTVLKKGKALKDAKVDLAILEGDFFAAEVKTDAFGRFAFYDIPVNEGQMIHLKAYEVLSKGKNTENTSNIELVLDKSENVQLVRTDRQIVMKDLLKFDIEAYLKEGLERRRVDSLFAPIKIELDNVTIVAKKQTRDAEIRKQRSIIYPRYNNRIEMDSIAFLNPAWNVFEMVAYLTPGAQLIGQRPFGQGIRFRSGLNSFTNNKPASVMLDGTFITPEFAASLDILNIEFFDVLRSMSSTAIFGNDGAGGVIALYSRMGQRKSDRIQNEKFSKKIIFDGFHQPREFYSPDYGSDQPKTAKPDLRTTLYWSPHNKTDAHGKAEFRFFTGDIKSEYLISIQGMTSTGVPFSSYKKFSVK